MKSAKMDEIFTILGQNLAQMYLKMLKRSQQHNNIVKILKILNVN